MPPEKTGQTQIFFAGMPSVLRPFDVNVDIRHLGAGTVKDLLSAARRENADCRVYAVGEKLVIGSDTSPLKVRYYHEAKENVPIAMMACR